MKPEIEIPLNRLLVIRAYIAKNPNNPLITEFLNAGELSSVNAYRKTMGPAPITIAKAIDAMIEGRELL